MTVRITGPIIDDDDGWMYDFLEMDYFSPKKMHDAMNTANGEDLDIEINSPGGLIFAASDIYAAIQAYKGKVNIHITGLAASAASVIACAGHSDMARTAQMMVHNVSAYQTGDYHDMDKMSEQLKIANRTIAAAYSAKAGMTEAEALDLMDHETWLTAEDAVKYGLVDEIAGEDIADTEPIKLVASYDSGLLPAKVTQKLKARREALELDLLNLKEKEI